MSKNTICVQTSELIGSGLNWAVAQCQTEAVEIRKNDVFYSDSQFGESGLYCPSENWAHGGPIIEKEKIQLRQIDTDDKLHRLYGKSLAKYGKFRPTDKGVDWVKPGKSYAKLETGYYQGKTPLVAAMRCYVASKFGDTINVPKELIK